MLRGLSVGRMAAICVAVVVVGCGGDPEGADASDAGNRDLGNVRDLGVEDLGTTRDLGVDDLGVEDLGTNDLGVEDLGTNDLGVDDVGVEDLGVADLGVEDVGVADLGVEDLGVADGGFDAEVRDLGGIDAGTSTATDGGIDAGTSTATDGGLAPDVGFDAEPVDLGFDAGAPPDVGVDSGARDGGIAGQTDAGPDSGVVDSGSMDAGFAFASPRVLFSSKRDQNNYNIFLTDLTGAGPQQLTFTPGLDIFASWAPDGSRFVFASDRHDPTGDSIGIFAYEFANDAVVPISVSLQTASAPVYSPDGSLIAFEGRTAAANAKQDIYVIPATGGTPLALTTDVNVDAGPVWSPDGAKIYFVSNRPSGVYDVWSMTSSGRTQRRVTTNSGILGKPAIHPNGNLLAFARLNASDISEIAVRDLTTGVTTIATSSNDSEPQYSSDGHFLVFTSIRTGNPEVMVLDLINGGAAVRLTNHPSIDGAPAVEP